MNMDPVRFTFPIAKFEKLADGRMLIEGVATDETLDSQGDILDYDGSKKAFGDWRGNIREAHDPKKPVGKALEVNFDDDKKTIGVKAFISSGAQETQAKIQEGVLSCFSVGGGNPTKTKRELVDGKSVRRVLEWPMAELSTVDAGANPNAVFQLVKADGVATEILAPDDVVDAANRFAEAILKAVAQPKPKKPKPSEDTSSGTDTAQVGDNDSQDQQQPEKCAKCMKVHKEGMEECDKEDVAAADVARAKQGVDEAKAKHKIAQAKEELAAAKGKLEEVKSGGSPQEESGADADTEKAKAAVVEKKDFTAEERKKLAEKGEAMPDGSFPTPTKADWNNAVSAQGRAPAAKRPAIKAYLKRRAKKLGIKELPDSLKVLDAILAKHWGGGEEYDIQDALQCVFGLNQLAAAEAAEGPEEGDEDGDQQEELLEVARRALCAFIELEAGELVESDAADSKAVGGAMPAALMHERADRPIFLKALDAALAKRFKSIEASIEKMKSPVAPADLFKVHDGDQLAEGIGKGLSSVFEPITKANVELKGLIESEFKGVRGAIVELGKTAAIPTPLRTVPREDQPRGEAFNSGVAALEKALASTTHPETMAVLRQQIAIAKAGTSLR